MSSSELILLRAGNCKKNVPKKAFLVVQEDNFPSTFACPILASINKKMCHSKEF